ncbi:hypothetical protein [Afifella pfennigii]|uniref:hypothetical protein n=1 Tax=Afifella pfennigii TaxID=209897 RepID=UPI000551D1F5|nr:hypothetical protein [Afifella pfennigii]
MRPGFIATLVGLLLAACAAQTSSTYDGWYQAREARPPQGRKVFVCHAFGCLRTTPVTFTEAEVKALTLPLRDAATPAAERAAISDSVQAYERIVGARIGTSADTGGFEKIGGGDPTQMDCLDEATNTTSLLLLLAGEGALKHHQVLSPVARGFFLDGRYPHATAVIGEKGGGPRYAVDSWPNANAEPPEIMPLKAWFAARGGAS